MKKKKLWLVSGALAVAGMLIAIMVATIFATSPVAPSTEPPQTGGGGTTPPTSGDGSGPSSPPTPPPGLGGAVPPLKWGLKDPTHVDSANAKAQALRLGTEATASGILEKIGLGFVFHVPNGHS